MDLYIKNREFETVDIIDTASSVIWREHGTSPGDFEIYIPVSEKSINALRYDYYVCRQDTDRVMIIKNIRISTDEEIGNFMIVTGPSLESILHRRIIWTQTRWDGLVEMGIRQLIYENLYSPIDDARRISNFKFGTLQGFTEKMNVQFTGDNLGEVVTELCNTYGICYKITLQDGYFVFDLFKGTDRSYNQSENPYVVFSPQFENLQNSEYDFNSDNYKNVVLVAGEGEGLDRKTQAVGTASGLDRYEMYTDARSMSTNNGEISDAVYFEQLAEDGRLELQENTAVETFNGVVNYTTPYVYGIDYFLGDTVQVINEYGISGSPTIVETIECEDENGYTLIPTFQYTGGIG